MCVHTDKLSAVLFLCDVLAHQFRAQHRVYQVGGFFELAHALYRWLRRADQFVEQVEFFLHQRAHRRRVLREIVQSRVQLYFPRDQLGNFYIVLVEIAAPVAIAVRKKHSHFFQPRDVGIGIQAVGVIFFLSTYEERTPIQHVPNLCGLNINPQDAKGVFQQRLTSMMGQMTGTFGNDVISTPCVEEMATFDQFVTFLQEPDADVIVFDTAPTGKTLRELAMPFDWAGFLQKQIQEGKELAKLMNMDDDSFAGLERDRRRYEHALNVLRNP